VGLEISAKLGRTGFTAVGAEAGWSLHAASATPATRASPVRGRGRI